MLQDLAEDEDVERDDSPMRKLKDLWAGRLLQAMRKDQERADMARLGWWVRNTTIPSVPDYMNAIAHPYPEAFKPQKFRLGLLHHNASDEAMDSTSERIKRAIAAVVGSDFKRRHPDDDIERLSSTGGVIHGWHGFVSSIILDKNFPWKGAYAVYYSTGESVKLEAADPDIQYRLALDAVFVLVVLCTLSNSLDESANFFHRKAPAALFQQHFQHVVRKGGLEGRLGSFFTDLVLLENQIPMGVLFMVNKALHRMYDDFTATHTDSLEFALTQAVVRCFPFICNRARLHDNILDTKVVIGLSENMHILDCVYRVVCGRGTNLDKTESLQKSWYRPVPSKVAGFLELLARRMVSWWCIRCHSWRSISMDDRTGAEELELYRVLPASKLAEAGIVVRATAVTLQDVQFEARSGVWRHPTLCLPKVKITHNTSAVFRNLGLYEQLCYPDRYFVRSYLQLMDQLVDSKEDVQVLSKRGVFVNLLDDDKAADMWNHMCDGLSEPIHSDAWEAMVGAMCKHYTKVVQSRWYEFKRTYCDSSRPWVIGGSLLFLRLTVCTITSTVIDILQLVDPPK